MLPETVLVSVGNETDVGVVKAIAVAVKAVAKTSSIRAAFRFTIITSVLVFGQK